MTIPPNAFGVLAVFQKDPWTSLSIDLAVRDSDLSLLIESPAFAGLWMEMYGESIPGSAVPYFAATVNRLVVYRETIVRLKELVSEHWKRSGRNTSNFELLAGKQTDLQWADEMGLLQAIPVEPWLVRLCVLDLVRTWLTKEPTRKACCTVKTRAVGSARRNHPPVPSNLMLTGAKEMLCAVAGRWVEQDCEITMVPRLKRQEEDEQRLKLFPRPAVPD